MPRAATVIAMAVIVDVIVDVAVSVANVASGQQVRLPIPPRIPRLREKQNPVKKVVVVIAMAVPSALKSRAVMQTLQALSQAML
jgi:hypothetical protein